MSEAEAGALARSRKPRHGRELLCESVYRPLAHVLVVPLSRLRVPPPLVVAASGVAGTVAAVELAQGRLVAAALVLQAKTVLDNADGQLARLTGRVTAFGRYLDSEVDLLVDALLFAALGLRTGRPLAALAGFVALTAILSVNFNLERLRRAEHAHASAGADEGGRATAAARRAYALLYGWQDRLVERAVASRVQGRTASERLAYHDAGTVAVLANLGLSTQLAVFGAFLAAGRPLPFVWLLLAQLVLVAALVLRRELRLRAPVTHPEEVV